MQRAPVVGTQRWRGKGKEGNWLVTVGYVDLVADGAQVKELDVSVVVTRHDTALFDRE
jgi:hypothetical protein